MKQLPVITTIYASIIELFDGADIINKALSGNASNLFTDVIQDHSATMVNFAVAEFLKQGIKQLDTQDIADILESPDFIARKAAEEFRDALATLLHDSGANGQGYMDAVDRADSIMRHTKSWFDSWGDYYVYANPWSNACTDYYIIRANDEADSHAELITRFESDFESDDIEDAEQDGPCNENGTVVDTGNLTLLGSFKFSL